MWTKVRYGLGLTIPISSVICWSAAMALWIFYVYLSFYGSAKMIINIILFRMIDYERTTYHPDVWFFFLFSFHLHVTSNWISLFWKFQDRFFFLLNSSKVIYLWKLCHSHNFAFLYFHNKKNLRVYKYLTLLSLNHCFKLLKYYIRI